MSKGVRIEVHAEGFESVFTELARLEDPAWEPLLRIMGATIQEQTVNHFTMQAGPSGSWPPTQRGGAALIKTGTLRGSIQTVVGTDEVEIGTNIEYAKYHQLGTKRIPQRAFLGLTDTDQNELQRVIENYVANIVGE